MGPPGSAWENIGPALLAVVWVFGFVTDSIVGLRLYTRWKYTSLRFDDILIVISLVFICLPANLTAADECLFCLGSYDREQHSVHHIRLMGLGEAYRDSLGPTNTLFNQMDISRRSYLYHGPRNW